MGGCDTENRFLSTICLGPDSATRSDISTGQFQACSRFAKRLTALVRKRCNADLVRAEGVEDNVQSVFKTPFDRIGQGYYDIPDGQELWRLLLVIALNAIRGKAVYYQALKRDLQRFGGGLKTEHQEED
jgi:hypothetical protein